MTRSEQFKIENAVMAKAIKLITSNDTLGDLRMKHLAALERCVKDATHEVLNAYVDGSASTEQARFQASLAAGGGQ